jgi:hypothetical protein
MAAIVNVNIYAADPNIPDEVELDEMLARIGLGDTTRDRFREVYGYRTGKDFLLMDFHKKASSHLFSAMTGQPPVPFSKRLADGVISARYFAQFRASRGQVPFTPASYAPNPADLSEAMQFVWHERATLLMHMSNTVAPLVIAPFTDMQRFPSFKSNTAAACATVRSPGNGAYFSYLLRFTGEVTLEALNAVYASIDQNLVATTVHAGMRYDEDNRILFRAIATSVSDGRLGAFIDPYRDAADGRGAYLAIVLACYDPSMAPARIERAKETLRNLKWVAGGDLETYIRNVLEQHSVLIDNQHVWDPSEKAMSFRRGLSSNERYRSVVIAWAADTTFEWQCSQIRTALSNDNDFNRNGRTADNRRVNQHVSARRSTPAKRTAKPTTGSSRRLVKGHKLPKSGIELHNGQYSVEDIKLLRQHGEYEEMTAFRALHAPPRGTNAVATSDRLDGDAASQAGQSIRSTGSRSQFSAETASLRSNERGNAMVATGRPRLITCPHTTFEFLNHRSIDNTPSWMKEPRFVSEKRAAHSRQSATTSLGPRWQAPTNRGIDAVAVMTRPPTVIPAAPTKPPTRRHHTTTVKKPAAKKASTMPTLTNPVSYSSSSDSEDSEIRLMDRAYQAHVLACCLAQVAVPVAIIVATW